MLKVWIPGTQDFSDQGLGGLTWTNHNTTINDSGKIGKCINFAGSQYLHVAEKIITSDKVSICFWINPVNVSYNKGIMNGRNANNQSFAIYMIGAAIRIDTGTNWSTGYELTANTWTHVAFVSDGTTQKLYINGVLNKNRTAAFDYSTIANYFTIGCEHINGGTIGTYFSGKLNDIRIYDDEVLSSKQVADIAKGLILHYPLSGPTEHQTFGDAIEDKETYLIRRTPGYNLINNLYAAGRTTVNNNTVTALLSQNRDTYFHFSCSEPLIAGEKYTLSLNCSGFPSSDNYLDFGIIAQNSGKNIRMKNGYCKVTFSPNSNIAASSKIIVDDLGRGASGYQDITITDIKLEKGEVETPWIEKNSEFDQIVGGTVAWNQPVPIPGSSLSRTTNGIILTDNRDGSYTFSTESGGATADTTIVLFSVVDAINRGHVYFLGGGVGGSSSTYRLNDMYNGVLTYNDKKENIYKTPTYSSTSVARLDLRLSVKSGTIVSTPITFNPYYVDLTLLFGPTIADYVYTLETATAGAGVAWFKKLFPKDYYPYCAPTMKSVTGLISHNTTGFNYWTNEKYQFTPNKGISINEDGSIRVSQVSYQEQYNSYPIPVSLQSERWHIQFDYKCVSTTSSSASFYIRFSYTDGTYSQERIGMGTVNQTGSITLNSTSGKSVNSVYFGGWSYSGVANISNICLNIYDEYKNGTYEPYVGRSYALDSNVVLRGFWKLNDNNKLYCDGDVYSGDGTVERRYVLYNAGLLNWTYNASSLIGSPCFYTNTISTMKQGRSNISLPGYITKPYRTLIDGNMQVAPGNTTDSRYLVLTNTAYTNPDDLKASLDNVYWLCELATPTTETATPFSNPQVCSIEGTEEYVIAEQDGVIIPAGHQTKYLHDVLEGRYHTYEEAVSGMGINDNIEYDVSGYQRNGTKTGALKYDENTPKYTYSTKFDGVNAIKLPNFVYTSGVWTVSIWYYYSTIPSAYQSILYFGKGDGSDSNKKISISPNSTYIWFKTENKNVSVSNITKDKWVNITLTSDGTTGKIYIDGVYSTSLSITSVLTDCTDLVVGARASASGCTTIAIPMNNGMLSDFRFYSTCFSADEVYQLYSSGVAT